MLSKEKIIPIVVTAVALIATSVSVTIYYATSTTSATRSTTSSTISPTESIFDEAMVSLCDSSPASQSQTDSSGRQSIYEGKQVPNIADYPWMVYLRSIYQSGNSVSQCAATLIDDRHLLTAAHCVSFLDIKDGFLQNNIGEVTTAHFGSTSKNESTTVKAIESAFMHVAFRMGVKGGRWEENKGFRDIAVLRLNESLLNSPDWNTKIKPACLPTATEMAPRDCVVVGWGKTVEGQLTPIPLFMKDIQIINYTECAYKFLSMFNKSIQNLLLWRDYEDSILCSKGPDVCRGDSGGPLACKTKTNQEMKLFGIISTASPGGCGSSSLPSTFINVPFFRSWLQYVALLALRNETSSAAWLACLKQKCLDFGYVQLAKGYTDQRIKQYVTSWICRLFPPYYFCTLHDPKAERCQKTVVPKSIGILSETPTIPIIGRNGTEELVYDTIDGFLRKEVIDSFKEITSAVSDLDSCTP